MGEHEMGALPTRLARALGKTRESGPMHAQGEAAWSTMPARQRACSPAAQCTRLDGRLVVRAV